MVTTTRDLRDLIEGHVRQLMADSDVTSAEVLVFLSWLRAFAEMQRAEMELETWN